MAIKKPGNLSELFIIKIRSLYDIEQELLKALPKMAKKASNPVLKRAFEDHYDETLEQARRLEEIFVKLEEKPVKTRVEAIRGLVKDTQWAMANIKEEHALDALLISAGRYVEHYEMAGYESAVEWAELLGLNEIKDMLKDTYKEERSADEKLSSLAMAGINREAIPV